MSKRSIAVLMVIVVGVIICGLAWYYVTLPTPTPTPKPTPTHTSTPTSTPSASPVPFSMEVISRPITPVNTEEGMLSIAGQSCIFLVVIEDKVSSTQGSIGLGEAIEISATGPSTMADIKVYPQSIIPGQIAEVTVIPSATSVNDILTITITGKRHGIFQTEKVTIEVIPGEDTIGSYATEMRDMFIPWLATNHPELGVTDETEWTGTIVNPRILVVMHYIFFSEDWEMYLTWHVTIPPHDWTRIYLRNRFSEPNSSHAFEISSVTAQEEPHAIEVPDWV